MDRIFRSWFGAASAALLIVSAAGAAQAAPTTFVRSGQTRIKLDTDFAELLDMKHLEFKPGGGAASAGRTFSFPVSGGVFDRGNLVCEVVHRGELIVSGSGRKVVLSNLALDLTGVSPVISAVVTVDGVTSKRVPIFSVTLPVLSLPVPLTRGAIVIKGNGLSLTAEAAMLFNSTFFVVDFTGGMPVGNANLKAKR